jgi:hypothetical protein
VYSPPWTRNKKSARWNSGGAVRITISRRVDDF